MPYARKRRLENEKKLQFDARKCKRINSFLLPPKKTRAKKKNESKTDDNDIKKITEVDYDCEHIHLPDQDDDEVNDKDVESVDIDKESRSNTEIRQTPDSLNFEDDLKSDSDQPVESGDEDISGGFYRGFRLDAKAMVRKVGNDVLSLFTERSRAVTAKKSRKRLFIKCCICSEHEKEAKQFAANHKVYMAQGVRCDSKKKLKDVIDHLHGAPHEAAMERAKLIEQWSKKDSNHPWLKTLKTNYPAVINTLVHMAVDVYNDSKLLTPSAWSWPSRSLVSKHAEQQAKKYDSVESNGDISEFKPTAVDLHYRDPTHYAELLAIQGSLEKEKLKAELQSCLRFSMQIDGLMDAKQHDKKYIFVRFNKPESPLDIQTRYVNARESEKRGAKELFCAAQSSMEEVGLTKREV